MIKRRRLVLSTVPRRRRPWRRSRRTGDYPNRTVRMVVPFAPGGASDHVARIIQPKIETE